MFPSFREVACDQKDQGLHSLECGQTIGAASQPRGG